ncbi:MAG: hypothetical protein QXD66_05990 [Candidatus Nezhaarchaeales archaeon]|nr:MAG: hypothetical protein DSO06_01240 [Candidatus Nezhaarchaeota archaeon WYZ-LMO8]TDA37028.1 MAG: hypothetical protein DSO05_01590 [Candidatus Nezhaarchaeota archaeon WYZ-LMO7]
MSSNKLKVNSEVVERTYRIIRLALELDEYWRRTTPLYELSNEDVERILSLLAQIEEVIFQLRKELGSKP